MSHFWMVRAGEGGYLAQEFEKNGCVAIGWPDVGDLTGLTDLDQVRQAVRDAYPDARPGNVIISGSTLHKFRSVIRQADQVVSYDPVRREYMLGAIRSDYRYNVDLIPEYPHIREVAWSGRVSRDALGGSTKNTLGSVVSLFEPGLEILRELQGQIGTSPAILPEPVQPTDSELDEFDIARQDAVGRAHEFLKDRLLRLSPEEMESLVASVLRAMGYKARVTPRGPDRGRDVEASPDGLGFQSPRIVAEVKHRQKESMGADRIRSFLGGLREGDSGLYVSTGGYTKEAQYEAVRSTHPMTLVDLDRLAELVVEHYERFDEEGRSLVPLIRVYWPAS